MFTKLVTNCIVKLLNSKPSDKTHYGIRHLVAEGITIIPSLNMTFHHRPKLISYLVLTKYVRFNKNLIQKQRQSNCQSTIKVSIMGV